MPADWRAALVDADVADLAARQSLLLPQIRRRPRHRGRRLRHRCPRGRWFLRSGRLARAASAASTAPPACTA